MLPNSNITTTMVANELQVSTRNIGQLCTSDKINQWSKNKPIRYNKVEGLTDSERLYHYYGFSTISWMSDPTRAYKQTIEYLKPRGKSHDEPYRIGDFRGYDHDVQAPLLDKNFENIVWDLEEYPSYSIELRNNDETNAMKVGDFHLGLNDCYLCLVIISHNDSSAYQWKTSYQQFKDGGFMSIDLNGEESAFQSDYVQFFLCATNTYKPDFENNPDTAAFLPLPTLDNKLFTMEIRNWQQKLPKAALDIIILNDERHNYIDPSGGYINDYYVQSQDIRFGCEVLFTNDNDTDLYVGLQDIYMQVYVTDHGSNQEGDLWYYLDRESDTFTIPAHGTYRFSVNFTDGYITIADDGLQHRGHVILSYKNVQMFDSQFILYKH